MLAPGVHGQGSRVGPSDWPSFRGSRADGRVFSGARANDPSALSLTWRVPLGSGYSGISVVGDTAVTMFTDGARDLVAAFDATTGRSRWSADIHEIHRGHDGSEDGPISTPAVADGRVFALGAKGRLLALDLRSGTQLWSRDLVADGATPPYYGFTTSPLVVDDLVIVEVGGEQGAVTAFEASTGEVAWSSGSGTVDSQSPVLIQVDGQSQVVYSMAERIGGLDPDEGAVLWQWDHGGTLDDYFGSATSSPLHLGEGRLFLNVKNDSGTLFRVQAGAPSEPGSRHSPDLVWEERVLGRTYSPPTVWENTIYGYSSRFLSAVDADSGKLLWRSRAPGDGFLSVVGGNLLVITKEGTLHLGPADRSGWQEVASLSLFDDLVWTPPSVANGAVYVRSIGALARVDLLSGASPEIEVTSATLPTVLEPILESIREGADADREIDAFLAGREIPIVESDRALFLWRGDARDVGVAGDFLGLRIEEPLQRIDGTDLWWYEAKVEPGFRIGYVLYVDYEPTLDPLNPRREASSIWGYDANWLRGPEPVQVSWLDTGAPPPPRHLVQPDPARPAGTLVQPSIPGTEMKPTIWLPPDYEDSNDRYPVVYVHDVNAIEYGRWTTTLDQLAGIAFETPIVVFLSAPSATDTGFVETLVPWVDEHYRTRAERSARANVGWSFPASDILATTFEESDTFGAVGVQTYLGFEEQIAMALEPLGERDADDIAVRIYMDWGELDIRSPSEGWDMREFSQQLFDELNRRGFEVAGGRVADSTDWKSWRNRSHLMLAALLPLD